ncbi:ABC transporter permease [Phytohabitans kaempferiae]|uniref:ABC transporter permease n=1 Tax=Phytohabitans kaempferiae TaxID=1620943 RepID=A0ABV6M380_9ACTN
MRILRPAPLPEKSRATAVKNFVGAYGLPIVFLLVVVYLSISAENFLTVTNLVNVVRQSSMVGFLALGLTFVMITAGIDLSVGSIVGLSGVVAATMAPGDGAAFLLPILLGLAIGALVGAINASLIIFGGILPFLATLAVMAAVRSGSLIFTDGQPVAGLSERFQALGTGEIASIPVPVILFLACALIADFILSRTRFGRHVYAVGGNQESAQKVGISVRAVLARVYIIAGVLAAIGGVVLTARVNGADPLAGTGYELQAIAAVVIGGTSLFGGIGTIRGTVLGVLLVGVVMNGLNLLNVSSYYQQAIQGLILVVAVLLNRWKPL